jgi:glycine cleavage system regulatory protein
MLRLAAEERLAALESRDRALIAVQAEADQRSALLADLTALLEERDEEILRLQARLQVRAQ